jgi:phosphoglycerol transferase
MKRTPLPEGAARAFGAYAAAAGISAGAAYLLLELWKSDLRVPFDYSGDALLHALIVKTTLDHGWWWVNPSVGAPGVLDLHDFPVPAHDTVHLLLIKAMSLFSSDWAVLFNLYFLLGFPLITWSAMAVFRHFRVGYGPAIVAGVLYSFLPSRLIKGEGHLFLDVFYEVPLAVLVLLWVCGDNPPLVHDRKVGRWPRLELRHVRSWGSLLVCGLLAATSFYYAAFAGMLLLAGGLWASTVRRSASNALAGAALAGVIVLGLGGSVLPSAVYHARHGPNSVSDRGAWEAEIYALKIAQLLLPADGHRLQALLDLKQRYNKAPLVGENGATSLGLVGDAGFLLLLGVVLSGRHSERGEDDLLRPLAVLNLTAVLLGTIGGFGSLFALLVHPQVRGYLRINVYIGFFSLLAVVLILQQLTRRRPYVGHCALLAVLVFGLLDQSTWRAVRPYGATKKEYASDAALVRQIEAALPAGAMIFQLPYMRFPEMPKIHGMDAYDPVRLYLHSHALRWSYPTMRNRAGDRWAQDVTTSEPTGMLHTLADVGFRGILVDREGYVDHGSAIEAAFRADLHDEPLVSENRRFAYFDVTDYARRRHAPMSSEELAYKQQVAARPISFLWDDGCYEVEHDAKRAFRWCRATGNVRIHNGAPFRRKVSVSMNLSAAQSPARLALGGLLSETIDLVGVVPFVREIDVPPGEHVVRFDCDGKRADAAPADPRTMVWQVAEFTLEEILVPAEQSPSAREW